MSAENSRLIRAALEALGREDPDGFSALLHPEIEIETDRGVRRGRRAALDWASKRFDHLVRVWAVDEIQGERDRLLVVGRLQYVWRDGGEVGDETPVALGFELTDGQIQTMRIFESVDEGLENFKVA